MKTNVIRKVFQRAVLAVAAGAAALIMSACGSSEPVSVDAKGNYSYQSIDNAARYVIEIYNASDVDETAGTVNEDAKYVTRKSFSPSQDKKGNSTSFASVKFGEYVPVVYAIYSDRKTTTDKILGKEYTVGGTLTAPDVMYTNKGLGALVRIKQNSMKNYVTSEAIYSFTTEVYSDADCKNLVTSVDFGQKAQQANNTFYRFHTGSFTVDQPGTYYVRTKANGNAEAQVEDSDWSDVVAIDLSADTDDTYSFEATIPKDGDGYDLSGLSFDFIYDLMWHNDFTNATLNDNADGEVLDFTCTGGAMGETIVFHLLDDGTLYIDGPSQIPVDLISYTGTWTQDDSGNITISGDCTDYNANGEDELSEGSGIKGAITIKEGWG